MRSDAQTTLIVVEPGGTAVLVRTPLMRSLRFRSLDEARRFHDASMASVLPMLIAGVIAAVLHAVLPDETFIVALPIVLVLGGVASYLVSRRSRPDMPEATTLSWEESVRIDPREHPPARALKDLGVALASAALLAFMAFVVYDDGGHHLRQQGLFVQLMVGVFAFALCVAVAAGIGSAVQRMRFHSARERSR